MQTDHFPTDRHVLFHPPIRTRRDAILPRWEEICPPSWHRLWLLRNSHILANPAAIEPLQTSPERTTGDPISSKTRGEQFADQFSIANLRRSTVSALHTRPR